MFEISAKFLTFLHQHFFRAPPSPVEIVCSRGCAARPLWGKLHSRHTLSSPPRPAAPPPRPLRRKQGHRAIDLGGLLGNLFPRRGRPRGEGRSSEIQVKPYLGKPLPRPPGRPPTRNSKLLRRGKLVSQVPRGTLAQAISLGVVAAVLAV